MKIGLPAGAAPLPTTAVPAVPRTPSLPLQPQRHKAGLRELRHSIRETLLDWLGNTAYDADDETVTHRGGGCRRRAGRRPRPRTRRGHPVRAGFPGPRRPHPRRHRPHPVQGRRPRPGTRTQNSPRRGTRRPEPPARPRRSHRGGHRLAPRTTPPRPDNSRRPSRRPAPRSSRPHHRPRPHDGAPDLPAHRTGDTRPGAWPRPAPARYRCTAPAHQRTAPGPALGARTGSGTLALNRRGRANCAPSSTAG
ncbi:hypothetical protein M2436_007603 [Streptomyces sp. HB372]|nr:hypothetical protein [Streptomyces sp. HB372]